MKILRIRINNLNSLKGKHCLDLTKEPLASAGLFAITGSTGAGKTTLLDAITLALYGKVARYNESNPEHMMTRHCGECSAEVDFEVPDGVYTAVWQRHRAGKKADGMFQHAKRFIYDEAGREVTQKIREAEEKIVELLGLDYDRFLRSVLLAQGEFARFLKANPKDRSELLESLTGTWIYSQLGKRAHSEHKNRKEELSAKESEMELISIFKDEVRKEYEEDIKQGEDERVKLTKEIEADDEMLGKITSLEEERKRKKQAVKIQKKNEEDRKDAECDLKLLHLHKLTDPFAEKLVRLDEVKGGLKSATMKREEGEAAHASAKLELVKANCILRASTKVELTTHENDAKKAEEEVAMTTKDESEVRLWLDQHKHDKSLAEQIADLVTEIGELKNERSLLSRDWTDWRQFASQILPDDVVALPENLTKDSELKGLLDEFLGKAESKKKELDVERNKAKKQFELRKDRLDKTKRVEELEDHRHDLKSGEPCPLCGAREHPYADGSVPSVEITNLQTDMAEAQEIFEEISKRSEDSTRTLKVLNSNRDKLHEGVSVIETRREELERKLQPFLVKSPVHGDEDALVDDLKKRNKTYSDNLTKGQNIKDRKLNAERIAEQANEQVETLRKKISELKPLPEGVKVEPVATEDIPPVSDAEESYNRAVSKKKTTGIQVNDRKKDEANEKEKLSKLEENLENSVAGTEFQTIEKLRKARLDLKVAKDFEELDRSLEKEETEYKTLLNQASQAIAKLLKDKVLKDKVLEGVDAATFKDDLDKKKDIKDDLLEKLATRRNQIETDNENRKQRKEKKKELEKNHKELGVWKLLTKLIGSQDGSKFGRYAQSISLDILTRHANRHLAKLSDRYQICRDNQEELNLQVEDLHQAGTKRPMASLSGGESFLASLALALGLSNLAGRKVRIDSLFIDEGFGNLDSETLEIAISALECLRHEHKTVGIISHVELLKERISIQIVVEKKTGGESQFWIKSS